MDSRKKDFKDSSKIAEKNYQPSDYEKNSDLSSGLAITHEQTSDTMVEGTIDGDIDNEKNEKIPRKGYDVK
ncbi:YozQ family protein [Bacillus sp. Marseille-Q3570]|uniref:YozQ family protein n=1 Tax=Bacillus sp. Marseille-Q3570 TaxID=2963522 RepID=UPI0021B7D2B9|nr:YozQ family protein [Bacillus sp. Marseille-Q3570]